MSSCAHKMIWLCLMVSALIVEAQFKVADQSHVLEIHVISASPTPRTRKLHSNPRNILQRDPPANIVRIFSDAPPTLGRKTTPKSSKYRGYKSKCRCERIWKCQKMQMSIARCPPDHFMCCF